jgi:hypothetical protein
MLLLRLRPTNSLRALTWYALELSPAQSLPSFSSPTFCDGRAAALSLSARGAGGGSGLKESSCDGEYESRRLLAIVCDQTMSSVTRPCRQRCVGGARGND